VGDGFFPWISGFLSDDAVDCWLSANRAAGHWKKRALGGDANLFSSTALSRERSKEKANADEIRPSDKIRYTDGIRLADQVRHRASGQPAAERAA
jgi:hypothetical protein